MRGLNLPARATRKLRAVKLDDDTADRKRRRHVTGSDSRAVFDPKIIRPPGRGRERADGISGSRGHV